MRNRILLALAFLLWVDGLTGLLAQSQAEFPVCDAGVLANAGMQYDVGLVDEAIGRLRPCVPNGFNTKAERLEAYRLLALSYIVTDSLDRARSTVRQLVRADRKYQPDVENDPPLFADMVKDAKPAWYTWFYQGNSVPQWIGRAAIVGTAVSLPFLLKGETVQPLPEPPGFPSQ